MKDALTNGGGNSPAVAVSRKCKSHVLKIIENFPATYSIEFIDSLAKVPSGLLDGNWLWLGDYDLCTSISVPDSGEEPLTGKYCRTTIQKLIQTGICVPNSCTIGDIDLLMKKVLDELSVQGPISKTYCAEQVEWRTRDTAAVIVCGIFAVLVVLSTVYDIRIRRIKTSKVDDNSPVNDGKDTKQEISVKEEGNKSLVMEVKAYKETPVFAIVNTGDDLTYKTKLEFDDNDSNYRGIGPSSDNNSGAVVQNGSVPLFTRQNHQPVAPNTTIHFEDTEDPKGQEKKKERLSFTQKLKLKMHRSGILLSFSLITNWETFIKTDSSPKHLRCLNGIRVISMIWILVGHNYMTLFSIVDNLMMYGTQSLEDWKDNTLIGAVYAVDTFFFLSGFLVAYLTLKTLKKHDGKNNWPGFYIYRFIRLTPIYMFTLFFLTSLYYHMVTGAFEGLHEDPMMVKACDKYWWSNFLYINNFYPYVDNTCMPWTWYMANDTQFYVISPLFIVLLYRWRKIGWGVTLAAIFGSSLANGIKSHIYEANPVYAFSHRPSQDTIKAEIDLYWKPYFRIMPYLVGILLADIMFRLKNNEAKKVYTKVFVVLFWIVSLTISTAIIYGLNGNYKVDEILKPQWLADLFICTSRLAWALTLSWLVYACATGSGGESYPEIGDVHHYLLWCFTFIISVWVPLSDGPINWILSFKFWEPLSRLTFISYLIHIIIMSLYYYNANMIFNYNEWNLTWMALANISLTLIFSAILHLTVEAPLCTLTKIMLGK